MYGTNELHICATTQPRKLPTNDGNRPRASTRSQKVSTKQIAINNIHRRVQRPKNQILMEVQPVVLSPLVDQLKGFGQVSALTMLQHIFTSYEAIYESDLEENVVK